MLCTLYLLTKRQNHEKDFFKFCVLLRKSELYLQTIFISDQKMPEDVNKLGIFANDELSLGEIDVYGYDYDYTLAAYKKATVEKMIHSLAKKGLTFNTSCPKKCSKNHPKSTQNILTLLINKRSSNIDVKYQKYQI